MENNIETSFIKIVELNRNDELIENITNILKENNIKFKIDLEENWTIPYKYAKYIPKFSVYVEKGFEEKAIKLIDSLTISETSEDLDSLEEAPNDPTENQVRKLVNFRKISIATFLLLVLFSFIAVMLFNIFH